MSTAMLQPEIRVQTFFHWSDVSPLVAEVMGVDEHSLHHLLMEWMELEDCEAGNDSIGRQHNFDAQIAKLEEIVRKDVEESGEYEGLEGEELEEAINDVHYGLPFLKAIKKVLGEHSTNAAFLYSW